MRVLFQYACVWLLVPVFTATLSAQAVLSWRALPSENSGPSPRRGVVGVYDEASSRLVFQGAETANRQFLPDVWFFDLGSNTWSRFSGSEPSARCHHTFLVDADRGRALLFGGFPRTNELWSWDVAEATWTDITPGTGNPLPRCLHGSVVCPSRKQMIVYGGLNGGFTPDLSDTWSYSLTDDSWTLLVADSPPGRRYGQVMALDEARDRVILFGGLRQVDGSGSQDVGDLWAFDLSTKVWSELQPSGPIPSARQFARGDVLPDGRGMILFGGRGAEGFLNDLWVLEFKDLSWRRVETKEESPAPRFRHTLIIDREAERLWVAFGEGDERVHFADVWSLDLGDLTSPVRFFQRGDTNADNRRDLSDGVFILNHLFRDGEAPTCQSSADNDDSGVLDVSDAVYLLNHLFLGGPQPPDPYLKCGSDPTEDELSCRSYPLCE